MGRKEMSGNTYSRGWLNRKKRRRSNDRKQNRGQKERDHNREGVLGGIYGKGIKFVALSICTVIEYTNTFTYLSDLNF